MLIEHNNRSTEDKPIIQITFYNSSCPTKIQDSVCYESQQDASASKVFLRSANPPSVTNTTLKDSSSKVNVSQHWPTKSQCKIVNKNSTLQFQGFSQNSPFFLDFCAQLYGLQKSDFQKILEVKQSRVDHGQCWTMLNKTTLNRSANFPRLHLCTCEGKRPPKAIKPIKSQ